MAFEPVWVGDMLFVSVLRETYMATSTLPSRQLTPYPIKGPMEKSSTKKRMS